MFCSHCGNHTQGGNFCGHCGASVLGGAEPLHPLQPDWQSQDPWTNGTPQPQYQQTHPYNQNQFQQPQFDNQQPIGGLIALVLGIIGLVYAIVTIVNDRSGMPPLYTYSSPFTEHEILFIAILILSYIVLLVGEIIILSHAQRRKQIKGLGILVAVIGLLFGPVILLAAIPLIILDLNSRKNRR